MIRMTVLILLVIPAESGAQLQQVSAADVRTVAERGDDVALRSSVAESPVAARDAVQRLLERTASRDTLAARRALDAATRVAEAIAAEHRDSFPLARHGGALRHMECGAATRQTHGGQSSPVGEYGVHQ